MVARLQAASTSGYPVLLRTEAAAGHGIGTALSTRIEGETDVYTFLVDQLGMTTQSATAPVAADERPARACHRTARTSGSTTLTITPGISVRSAAVACPPWNSAISRTM